MSARRLQAKTRVVSATKSLRNMLTYRRLVPECDSGPNGLREILSRGAGGVCSSQLFVWNFKLCPKTGEFFFLGGVDLGKKLLP